ncbi:hypothetical protein GE107_01695 [Cohnella sp. CFH 77786]|uniref:hypothetical protein n=1 Tax=Cohnella sp. CFH 77786 TaxID=2662265 RepID=UPI001C608BEC|nr:hypothetical protein [Cohnella sp. CFH 77786]MBW5444776.1 hypothetical protein [Cohnella sp. CFH 77786]
MENSNDDMAGLIIKRFPRRDLEASASSRILSRLRQAAADEARRSVRNRRIRGAAIALAAVLILLAMPFVAAIAGQSESWFGRLFPPTRSPQDWNVASKFDLRDRDGRVVYPERLIGIEGKIAFLEPYDLVANAKEPVAKMFWYVWGDSAVPGTRLTATAVSRDTGKRFLLNETTLNGPIYGADAHALTSFAPFPNKGLWRIDVALNGKPFGRFVVFVKDEYIHTKTAKFLLSKDDAAAGATETVLVVPGRGDKETIEVRVSPARHEGRTYVIPFRKGDTYGTVQPITHYSGTLHFDAPGEWRIEVLGETTNVTVR